MKIDVTAGELNLLARLLESNIHLSDSTIAKISDDATRSALMTKRQEAAQLLSRLNENIDGTSEHDNAVFKKALNSLSAAVNNVQLVDTALLIDATKDAINNLERATQHLHKVRYQLSKTL